MKNNLKTSLYINIVVFILTLIAMIMMFTGYKFMSGNEYILETSGLGMLRFFTVQSNLFVGIVSLVFAIKEIMILKGKKISITKMDYLFKLMATTSVGLTFLIVFSYLGPISQYGLKSMLMNSNLFFHLLIPALSIINFMFFEKTDLLELKYTFYGIIPTGIYGLFYLINLLLHMTEGRVSPVYDWYWFVQNGVWTALIVIPLVMFLTYIVSFVIWEVNSTMNKDK